MPELTLSQISPKVSEVQDSPGFAMVYIDPVVNADDILTINARTYKWGAGGDVNIGAPAGTADLCADDLVTAINGDASRVVNAEKIGTGAVALVANTAGASTNYALAESTANARLHIGGLANLVGAAAAADKQMIYTTYTVTASDIILRAAPYSGSFPCGSFGSSGTPDLLGAFLRRANSVISPANISFQLQQIGAGNYVIQCTDTAGSVLVAGDVINCMIWA